MEEGEEQEKQTVVAGARKRHFLKLKIASYYFMLFLSSQVRDAAVAPVCSTYVAK